MRFSSTPSISPCESGQSVRALDEIALHDGGRDRAARVWQGRHPILRLCGLPDERRPSREGLPGLPTAFQYRERLQAVPSSPRTNGLPTSGAAPVVLWTLPDASQSVGLMQSNLRHHKFVWQTLPTV